LAREDRIRKCDECIEAFFDLSKNRNFLKALTRDGDIKEIARHLKHELELFLNRTKAEES